MSDFGSIITDAKVDTLQKVVSNGRQKYLCFTKPKDSKYWVILVTDGVDVWLQELDEDGLEALRDLNGVASIDAFLARFRNGFLAGDISASRVGNKLTLSVGKGGSTLEFDLFEAKTATEKRLELQYILFRLAENCSQLEIQLSAANQQIDSLKAQKSSTSRGLEALMDLSPGKAKGPSKARPKKVGMSIINPSSRRRKAATGVVFEGE